MGFSINTGLTRIRVDTCQSSSGSLTPTHWVSCYSNIHIILSVRFDHICIVLQSQMLRRQMSSSMLTYLTIDTTVMGLMQAMVIFCSSRWKDINVCLVDEPGSLCRVEHCNVYQLLLVLLLEELSSLGECLNICLVIWPYSAQSHRTTQKALQHFHDIRRAHYVTFSDSRASWDKHTDLTR